MAPMPSTPSSHSLATIGSPSLGSEPRVSTPKNYHPYLIQSTSSSLLTRSNSSPSQPIADVRHKTSRSMSSLAASASEGELDKVASGEKEVRRRSLETRPGMMKRSGTLPTFPRVDEAQTPTKTLDLPVDPKHWSPSELARYLSHAMRTTENLPAPLVKDIETWVLRHRIDGRAFLKGNQEWATSRPPPFLPLLLQTSRRLRRRSLQARLSNEMRPDDSPESGSVLLEEEEEEMSGVRRMANAIESPVPELRPQWTGGSSSSEVWRRRDGGTRKRRESGHSSVAESPVLMERTLSDGDGDGDEQGTIRAAAAPVGIGLGIKQSPPPPYCSPDPEADATPGRNRSTVTPTPERPGSDDSPDPVDERRDLYAALRQSGEGGTARRTTIRPNRVESIFAPKSSREAELEDQLAVLTRRVMELESRLEHDSTHVSEVGKAGATDLPTSIRQLPAYLFLVGVGVGAVVVRVLMRRR